MSRGLAILILTLVIAVCGGVVAYERSARTEVEGQLPPAGAVTVIVQPPAADDELLKRRLAGIGHARTLAPVQLDAAASGPAK
jgi:hypothetical protein